MLDINLDVLSSTGSSSRPDILISLSPRFAQYLAHNQSNSQRPVCVIKPFSENKSAPKTLHRDNPVPSIWLVRRKFFGYTAAVQGLGLHKILALKGKYWHEALAQKALQQQGEDKSNVYNIFGRVITVVRRKDVNVVEQANKRREKDMELRDKQSRERECQLNIREHQFRQYERAIAARESGLSKREMTLNYRELQVGYEQRDIDRRERGLASRESELRHWETRVEPVKREQRERERIAVGRECKAEEREMRAKSWERRVAERERKVTRREEEQDRRQETFERGATKPRQKLKID